MDNRNQAQSNSQLSLLANPENLEKWSQLVKRAGADETLKQQLLDDPLPLLQEQGIEMPAGAVVQVVEEGGIYRCLVGLAKAAAAASGAELTANDLSSVVGGADKKAYYQIDLQEVFITSYNVS